MGVALFWLYCQARLQARKCCGWILRCGSILAHAVPKLFVRLGVPRYDSTHASCRVWSRIEDSAATYPGIQGESAQF